MPSCLLSVAFRAQVNQNKSYVVRQRLDCTLGRVHDSLISGRAMTRILIADDNAMVRRALRRLIESHSDWQVCGEAMGGQEAIERARELHPDVLVMDLVMPGMNGFEAARQLAEVEPKLPILLCTVQISSYVVEKAQKLGIKGAVPKSETRQITDGIAALARHEKFYWQPRPAEAI
jgi:DNA-binding NarL/FixJ family response regulator